MVAVRRVNGVELFYEVSGTGEPMVLVHGASLPKLIRRAHRRFIETAIWRDPTLAPPGT